MIIKCSKGCCKLTAEKFTGVIDHRRDYSKYNKLKAGGILHDINNDKVLLVQSRGKLWGFPKGTKNDNETVEDCAVREIKEETGLSLHKSMLTRFTRTNNGRSTFYYVEYPEVEVEVQNSIENNDANGIGWVNINCLRNMIDNKILQMNRQSKIALKSTFK